ncbi:MAG TPA: hypothetical protein VFD52_05735 [Clostridia bacterium]|nr:hypothetical protein [Clostridia bacterium]
MIKGVNRQVVEVSKTECEYFEKILFFVKPECAYISEGKLRERADLIASGAGAPPPTKIRRRRYIMIAKLAGSALIGAAVSFLLLNIF